MTAGLRELNEYVGVGYANTVAYPKVEDPPQAINWLRRLPPCAAKRDAEFVRSRCGPTYFQTAFFKGLCLMLYA